MLHCVQPVASKMQAFKGICLEAVGEPLYVGPGTQTHRVQVVVIACGEGESAPHTHPSTTSPHTFCYRMS